MRPQLHPVCVEWQWAQLHQHLQANTQTPALFSDILLGIKSLEYLGQLESAFICMCEKAGGSLSRKSALE